MGKLKRTLIISDSVLIAIAAVLFAVIVFIGNSVLRNYQEKLDLGRKYYLELDYEKAILAFEDAINIEPKSLEAYEDLARIYIDQNDYESAIAVMNYAAEHVAEEDRDTVSDYILDYQKRIGFSVTGQIIDGTTDRPLSGAVVELFHVDGDVYRTTTDAEGTYKFGYVKNGELNVRVSKDGYEVNENTDMELDSAASVEPIYLEQTFNPGDYILPYADIRVYSDDELEVLSDENIDLAINEIYARHGRKFESEESQNYFSAKSWYYGSMDAKEFDADIDNILNNYEKDNLDALNRIKEMRAQPKYYEWGDYYTFRRGNEGKVRELADLLSLERGGTERYQEYYTGNGIEIGIGQTETNKLMRCLVRGTDRLSIYGIYVGQNVSEIESALTEYWGINARQYWMNDDGRRRYNYGEDQRIYVEIAGNTVQSVEFEENVYSMTGF